MDTAGAVVVDTNFVSGANVDMRRLTNIATRLKTRDYQVVVPEVVIWEWAAHAFAAVDKGRREAASLNKLDELFGSRLVLSTIEAVDEPLVDVFVDRIVQRLAAMSNVRVLDTGELNPAAAIRDQVTSTGMGSVRKEVKTGAADALVVQTLVALDEEYEQVVLASGDTELGRYAQQQLSDLIVVHTQKDFWQWYGLTPPSSTHLGETLQTSMLEQFEELTEEPTGVEFPIGEIVVDTDVLRESQFHRRDVMGQSVNIHRVNDAVVADVEVVAGKGEPHLAVGTLVVQGAATVSNWYSGGPDMQLIHEYEDFDVELYGDVIFELSSDWEPVTYQFSDTPHVRLASDD